MVTKVLFPLGQYTADDGRKHHQTEFDVTGPTGRTARVIANRSYAGESPPQLTKLTITSKRLGTLSTDPLT